MILGVICSLCIGVPAGMPVRAESPQRAPEVRLVSSQPESTLAQRVYDAVAAEHPLAVEVGNEPNLPRFWGGTITPSAYVQLYVDARNAARWADPNVPVISAGIADTNDWQAWITAIAAVHPDAIGLHPYIDPYGSAKWTRKYGRVAVTEVGIGKNGLTEDYRRKYLLNVISQMRKLGVWMTMLYSWDDPDWSIPSGVL